MRGATVTVNCARCRDPFTARVADRKRGWGRFCSKSCKAIRQTQRTGYGGPRRDEYRCDDGTFRMNPGEMNDHGQW